MAFIAGYVSARRQSIPTTYQSVPIPGGHLIATVPGGHPVPARIVTNGGGRALAALGFMLTEPKDALTGGAAALDQCEGEFVVAFADGGALHLVNDRFASRPCYILRTEAGTYFSTSLPFLFELAGERARPDVLGWLQVFTVGHTVGSRTTADRVQRLAPATHLVITPERMMDRQYWRLEHQPDPGLDPARHSAEVFQAFAAGAKRRARLLEPGVLALSGGLDSRLLAGAIPRGAVFSAFTFVDAAGAAETAQTRAAAAVCSALGLDHRIERLPERVAEPAEVLGLTGGMRPYQHMAIVMPYIAELRRRGRAALLGGGPGDSLAGAFVPSAASTDPARIDECMREARRRRMIRSRLWPLVFRDDVINSGRRVVQDELAASFDSIGGPTAAHRLTAWALVVRQTAATFTSAMHTHPDVTEAFCHLDYRYVDLMLRLPAPWLYKKAFYSYMIHRELPQLRHVPYANTGKQLTGRAPTLQIPRDTLADRALVFTRRAANRIARVVRPAPPARWLVMGDARLQHEVHARIHDVPALRAFLDIDRCDAFLTGVRNGAYQSSAHEEVLGSLTSLALTTA
jgi:hypothetical protein